MKVKVRFSGIVQEADGREKRLYNIYLDDVHVGDRIADITQNAKMVLDKIITEKPKKPEIAKLDEIEEEVE